MEKTVTLPRETNPARIVSQYRRTVRLVRKASADAKRMPNVGTLSRRRERTLAGWAVSRKVRFVRVYGNPNLRGAVRSGAVRKAARDYRRAHRAWVAYYQGSHTL